MIPPLGPDIRGELVGEDQKVRLHFKTVSWVPSQCLRGGRAGVSLLEMDPNWVEGRGQESLFSLDFLFHTDGQTGHS